MADLYILQSDPVGQGWFEVSYQLHCNLPGDLHLIKLSGVVKVVDAEGQYYKGYTSDDWRVNTLDLGVLLPAPFDNAWFQIESATPFVTLNSIYNQGEAVNAGWAVDKFEIPMGSYVDNKVFRQVSVLVTLAVRDSDGYIYRIGYDITLIGRLTTPPPGPI